MKRLRRTHESKSSRCRARLRQRCQQRHPSACSRGTRHRRMAPIALPRRQRPWLACTRLARPPRAPPMAHPSSPPLRPCPHPVPPPQTPLPGQPPQCPRTSRGRKATKLSRRQEPQTPLPKTCQSTTTPSLGRTVVRQILLGRRSPHPQARSKWTRHSSAWALTAAASGKFCHAPASDIVTREHMPSSPLLYLQDRSPMLRCSGSGASGIARCTLAFLPPTRL